MWDKYIGIPFLRDGRDINGLDCWGLVSLIYQEELDIYLPLYNGVFKDKSPETMLEISRLMKEEREKWIKVQDPQEFDVLLLRTGRYAFHVSLVIDSENMIHVEEGINSVIEKYTGPLWKQRIEGIYRYV